MADKIDRLKKIEEKLKRLKELKRKIEKRVKKEQKLSYEYAKELVFWYSAIKAQDKQNVQPKLLEKLKEVLCKRAKKKNKCLERKLKIVAEYVENDLAKRLAQELLKLLKEEEA